MQLQYISTRDQASIPVYWHCAQNARGTLLLQPALGIQAKLYNELAKGLADAGYGTAVIEQRGHGLSSFSPGYSCNYSFAETLDFDLPAVMQWLATEVPDVPRFIGGHSLGGHLSTVYTGMHPEDIHGVVHLACAFPYLHDYPAREQRMLRLLCALIPLFAIAPGYYPGHLLGFGERESISMMKQWRQWAKTGRFDFDDRRGLAEAVEAFSGPVISVAFEQDHFSNSAAVERALSPFCHSSVDKVTLGEAEQGNYLGHTAWAKSPEGVVAAVSQWLDKAL